MKHKNRRRFLKTSLLGGAGVLTLPRLLPSQIWAAETAPNSRLTMGFVGMGTQSRGLLGAFLGQGTQVVAVCDVDTTRREDAKKRVNDHYAQKSGSSTSTSCAAYNDFRELVAPKDIDAVCIATPVPITSPVPFRLSTSEIIVAFTHRPLRTREVIDQQHPRLVGPGQPPSCGNCPLLHRQIIKSP